MLNEARLEDFCKAVREKLKPVGIFSNNMILEKIDDDNWNATILLRHIDEVSEYTVSFNPHEIDSTRLAELFTDDIYGKAKERPKRNDYPAALSFTVRIVDYLVRKGINIIDSSLHKHEPRRRKEEWVFKIKTDENISLSIVFDLGMDVQNVADEFIQQLKTMQELL